MVISTEKSALTTSFSFIIQTILSNDDLSIPMQLLNSPVIDEHYLIIHTFKGAGNASLLLPNSEVEELLICLQWSRPQGAAVHFTAISSLQSLLD
jgi:hypothetical protein